MTRESLFGSRFQAMAANNGPNLANTWRTLDRFGPYWAHSLDFVPKLCEIDQTRPTFDQLWLNLAGRRVNISQQLLHEVFFK